MDVTENSGSVFYIYRHQDSGFCSIRCRDSTHLSAVRGNLVVKGLYRYNPEKDDWEVFAKDEKCCEITRSISGEEGEILNGSTVLLLPKNIGLFYIILWDGGENIGLMYSSGGMACEDLPLTMPVDGRVPACVPFEDHAVSTTVPDPEKIRLRLGM